MVILDATQEAVQNAQTLGAVATAVGGGSGTIFLIKWLFFDKKTSTENDVKHALMGKEIEDLKEKYRNLETEHKSNHDKLDSRIRDLEKTVNDNTNKILGELRLINRK